MDDRKNREIKGIFLLVVLVFAAFLLYPVIRLLAKSLQGDGGFTLVFYQEMLSKNGFLQALGNSFAVSGTSAALTTLIAFFLAYTIHYTNLPGRYRKVVKAAALLPMLLPTITYGFAIIYSFGKQGLLSRFFGHQLFEIYGFNGLLLGYVIYTLPISFMLLHNTMNYVDKKFMVVSRVMGDKPFSTFRITVVRPLVGTLMASFIQSFFLSFTDFGIPASVGGKYEVIASVLYSQMLGSVPDFHHGSVVAVVMLIPSVVSILALHYLERYNVRYNKISVMELPKSKARDVFCGLVSGAVILSILSVFLVILLIPFVGDWPYNLQFSMGHIREVFRDPNLLDVYKNSIYVAILTAAAGTLLSYGAAIITARSTVSGRLKGIIEGISLVTNTIPGMVLGLAFLFCFSGTSLQSTFVILVLCNIVHFFSTPYLMMKNSLAKMNGSWETTAMLMGDNWFQTIFRVVTPNAIHTILEVFSYYFVNAMVTVSAVIFIAGARTMVITTKIKELQYYNKFNEVFVLSLLILFTNLALKGLISLLASRKRAAGSRKQASLQSPAAEA
ncbi:MAG: ABC transporter permease subunit [Blautia sp.]|jgi:iron(III) transport system permease protein